MGLGWLLEGLGGGDEEGAVLALEVEEVEIAFERGSSTVGGHYGLWETVSFSII